MVINWALPLATGRVRLQSLFATREYSVGAVQSLVPGSSVTEDAVRGPVESQLANILKVMSKDPVRKQKR